MKIPRGFGTGHWEILAAKEWGHPWRGCELVVVVWRREWLELIAIIIRGGSVRLGGIGLLKLLTIIASWEGGVQGLEHQGLLDPLGGVATAYCTREMLIISPVGDPLLLQMLRILSHHGLGLHTLVSRGGDNRREVTLSRSGVSVLANAGVVSLMVIVAIVIHNLPTCNAHIVNKIADPRPRLGSILSKYHHLLLLLRKNIGNWSVQLWNCQFRNVLRIHYLSSCVLLLIHLKLILPLLLQFSTINHSHLWRLISSMTVIRWARQNPLV